MLIYKHRKHTHNDWQNVNGLPTTHTHTHTQKLIQSIITVLINDFFSLPNQSINRLIDSQFNFSKNLILSSSSDRFFQRIFLILCLCVWSTCCCFVFCFPPCFEKLIFNLILIWLIFVIELKFKHQPKWLNAHQRKHHHRRRRKHQQPPPHLLVWELSFVNMIIVIDKKQL